MLYEVITVKEYRPEEFLRLYRHDGYWEGPPPLSQLVFDYTPKASKRLTTHAPSTYKIPACS